MSGPINIPGTGGDRQQEARALLDELQDWHPSGHNPDGGERLREQARAIRTRLAAAVGGTNNAELNAAVSAAREFLRH